jgi:hypothetical protein
MPLERHLQRAIAAALDKIPGLVYRKRHGSAFAVRGDPDLYLLYAGRHVEIELKRPGENPTPLQWKRLEEWAAGGAVAAVVHSKAELLEVLAWVADPHLPPPFSVLLRSRSSADYGSTAPRTGSRCG